ncbi:UNVERIFIED_CONTAM: hypothetical protein Sradi_3208200, partial [Sesamum radiatum]
MTLKDILWRAAKATRMANFERVMNDTRIRNIAAYEWFMQRPATHWSKSQFSTHYKSDILLNNMSECFNMVLRARFKYIIDMLETIRLVLMKEIHMRTDQMLKHNGDLCLKIVKILEDMKKKSIELIAYWNRKMNLKLNLPM